MSMLSHLLPEIKRDCYRQCKTDQGRQLKTDPPPARGTPGVFGKTHLAIALGYLATQKGRFFSAATSC
jgi:hypothetical protein